MTTKAREAQRVSADELARWEIEQQVRREGALAARVAKKSYREIAAMFDVSTSTVHRWVKEEAQKEQIQKGRGIVGERLVPKALAVYDQELDKGNVEVATNVLYGAGVLVKNQQVQISAAAQDPLQRFREKFFGPPPAEVVEGEVKQLEEATKEADETVE